MCLIAAGPHIKKIDTETVSYKEREFAKLQIAMNPLIVEAIRNGWLMDMERRTDDQYRSIIEDMKKTNWDNRDEVKNTTWRVLSVPNVIIKPEDQLENFEPRKTIKRTDTSQKIPLLNQYASELKSLKEEISKKSEELKNEKERIKLIQEQHLNGEDISLFNGIDVEGFGIVKDQEIAFVRLRITTDLVEVYALDENGSKIKEISFNNVRRVS